MEDIKKKLEILLEEGNGSPRNAYLIVEKLIVVLLTDYIRKNHGEIATEKDNAKTGYIYDIYVPNGYDEFKGSTAFEIRLMRSGRSSMRRLYNLIDRIVTQDSQLKNLVIVTLGNVPDSFKEELEKQKKYAFNVYVWGIEDLVNKFRLNEELFIKTYTNINELVLKDSIEKGLSKDNKTRKEQHNHFLAQLKTAYDEDDLVLFLGAGVSREAKIATWKELISELYVDMINQVLKENELEIHDEHKQKLVEAVMRQNDNSPLIQTRFVKRANREGFQGWVQNALYKTKVDTSRLLEEIVQLCIPNRGKYGIKAVVTYNFDDLIENKLEQHGLKYKAVYCEGVNVDKEELGVFHVHGFLPEKGEEYPNLTESLLVFSEEGYHKLMLEPYNWANLTQLAYLTNNTCLFIGLSMTDPNLRRLLDIAVNKNPDRKCRHYVILKRDRLAVNDASLQTFDPINEELQGEFYRELGVNVIWVDEFDEIPEIIHEIKKTS